jgi:protein subunit release factor B
LSARLASSSRNITPGRLPGGKSAAPLFREADVRESFVRGGGSGGQSVAKTSNCVQLRHEPTGLVVRCHKTRSRDLNRQEARRLLQVRLDDLLHGAQSRRALKAAKRKKNKNRAHQKARAKAIAAGAAPRGKRPKTSEAALEVAPPRPRAWDRPSAWARPRLSNFFFGARGRKRLR